MTLKDQVRELRLQGKSPKEIARALKVAPSVVAPLVREIAAETTGTGEAEVVGCWINVGWSEGLLVDPARGWVDKEPAAGIGGMVSVLVARRHSWDRLRVGGFLTDVYCMGVKNAIGPDVIDDRFLSQFREYFFSDYPGWQEAPFELVQHLVLGSIEYARGLGFEPDSAYEAGADLLGTLDGEPAVTFGREGRPHYVEFPGDDPAKVLRTLRQTLTDDQFTHATADR